MARDLLASIRDGVIAVVENLVHTSLINTNDSALARTLYIQNQANSRTVDGKNMLGGNDLLEVARTIVDNSVGVEFPGGVFCVMTPRHAIQLLEGGDLRAGSMDVNGMDVVVSPAFWGGMDIGGGRRTSGRKGFSQRCTERTGGSHGAGRARVQDWRAV